jgi:kumamolisin
MKLQKVSTLLLLMLSVAPALAQSRDMRALFPNAQVRTLADGNLVITPASSIPQPPGKMHTNVKLFQPASGMPVSNPPFTGYPNLNTPGSLACLYDLVPLSPGCNPYHAFAVPKGGTRTIAIVDAYDAPNALADLATFSQHFGLPPASFRVVYALPNGTQTSTPPAYDPGWEVEISLDIQMAHSMAPKANIILVEAVDNSDASLYGAVTLAGQLVSSAGGGQVSNSWGGSEYPGEATNDVIFTAPDVVFFASSGDTPGTEYPSVSPNVVSVGGTTVNRTSAGNFTGYSAWADGGGGSSLYESRPTYQNSIAKIVGGARGVPDIAAVADPNTGVYLYVTNDAGWIVVGGTSVASPLSAGIANSDGAFRSSTDAELTFIYKYPFLFTDITQGSCGINNATKGWDFCTGWGSPKAGSGYRSF